jgi:hypothetical protein
VHLLEEGELLGVVGPVGHDVLQDVGQAAVVQMNQTLQQGLLRLILNHFSPLMVMVVAWPYRF